MSRRNRVREGQDGNHSSVLSQPRIAPEVHEEQISHQEPTKAMNHPEPHASQGGEMPAYALVIARHPVISLAAGFSVGFSLGVLLTAVLTGHEKSWAQRHHIPESFHDFTNGLRHLPEKFARHMS